MVHLVFDGVCASFFCHGLSTNTPRTVNSVFCRFSALFKIFFICSQFEKSGDFYCRAGGLGVEEGKGIPHSEGGKEDSNILSLLFIHVLHLSFISDSRNPWLSAFECLFSRTSCHWNPPTLDGVLIAVVSAADFDCFRK